MALDKRTVSGTVLSWGSGTILIGSEVVYGQMAISFENKIESAHIYGMGRSHGPRGHSRGKYVPGETKIKFAMQTAVEIRKALAAASPDGKTYGMVLFGVDYFGSEESSGEAFDVQFEDCKYTAESVSHDEGTDALVEELTLKPLRIGRDGGLTIYDSKVA